MAFQYKRRESVPASSLRIMRKELDKCLKSLKTQFASDETIHEVRKRFQKVRAILKLVRHAIGEKAYQRENSCFRDAAAVLRDVRDAKVQIDALLNLCSQVQTACPASGRATLEARRNSIRQRVLVEGDVLPPLVKGIKKAHARIESCTFHAKGWRAIGPGLKKTYKKARDAMHVAAREPTIERLHEWRKRSKYMWHQLHALEAIAPPVVSALVEHTHHITQLLGDDHDLAMLRERIHGHLADFGGQKTVQELSEAIDRRREDLKRQALAAARQLFAPRPSQFAGQLKEYWKVWRSGLRVNEKLQAAAG
jgi:CHAD domain-containing protein